MSTILGNVYPYHFVFLVPWRVGGRVSVYPMNGFVRYTRTMICFLTVESIPQQVSQPKVAETGTKDDVYALFMKEMQGLL